MPPATSAWRLDLFQPLVGFHLWSLPDLTKTAHPPISKLDTFISSFSCRRRTTATYIWGTFIQRAFEIFTSSPISYDGGMGDGKSTCSQCGQSSKELGDDGLCSSCRGEDQATIAPSPYRGADATIMPGQTSPGSFAARQLGDYDLIEEIARGGMGVVYKANHRNLNRVSAVKMILGGQFSSQEELQRFRIEAESAAKLDHPAIVPIYEIGEHAGQAFFAMKYIDGGSLADRADSFVGKPHEAAELVAKVADGVHHAHQRGVLHRDLKPANILLDRDGAPWVTDLGLAKSTSGESDLTQTGAVLGTPSYMPPEQAAGKTVTTSADVYSLGAILYELLVGCPPYRGDTTVNVVMQVIDGPPASPRSVKPEVDRDLELIVQKCMSREPSDRYSSANDLSSDLNAWMSGKPISVKPPSIRALIGKWYRENERLAYAAFALFMGILLCAPVAITFFSADLSNVYSQFPGAEKPLIFSVDAPGWLSGLSAIFLFLFIWPSIGWMNASISRPTSLRDAFRAGVTTAAVLGLIFYCLLGWYVFIQGADNSVYQDVEALTKLIWPPDNGGELGPVDLNEIYEGLDQIPEEERAAAVTRRIQADLYASAPTSFLIGMAVAIAFAVPIVIGTMVAWVLLGRSIPGWLRALRYLMAWWVLCAFFFATTGMLINFFGANLNVQGYRFSSHTLVALGVLLSIAWLVLRRWKKESSGVVASN